MPSPSQQFGQRQEQEACDYLTQQGLKLITSNFCCKYGEIDLIMQDGNTIVFVEVRYRNAKGYGSSLESVTKSKQRKIIRSAKYYLLSINQYDKTPCRFDVVATTGNSNNTDPQSNATTVRQWLKDAFRV